MRRDDLPIPIRRDLDRDRRRVCRAVGQGFDALVDAGEDPTEAMDEMMAVLIVRVREAQDRREAA